MPVGSLQELRLKVSKITLKGNQIKTQLKGICISNLITQTQRENRESAAFENLAYQSAFYLH